MADTEAMLGECLERLTREETESWQILQVGHMTIGRVIGRSLALEIELDPSQGAFLVVVRLTSDGNVPEGYYVDSEGRTVRRHVSEVLERVPESLSMATRLRAVLGLWDPSARWPPELCETVNDAWSAIRKREVTDILSVAMRKSPLVAR